VPRSAVTKSRAILGGQFQRSPRRRKAQASTREQLQKSAETLSCGTSERSERCWLEVDGTQQLDG
jgi:hypothetical protein